jgi:L-lactate dehydrogenase
LAGEIALIDIDTKRVEGEVMDLLHGLPFVLPVEIHAGSFKDCKDSNLIVITAGAKQKTGQNRLELVQQNTTIINSISEQIKRYSTDAVLIMVTNPVDILTQFAMKRLGWPRERVIGSGTVLDSARFRYMLSEHCGIDVRNVHAYVLGEHGDSEVTAWSMAHIAGVPISQYCAICKRCNWKKEQKRITQHVRDSAYHIIDYKGATYYAIGLSLVRITEAILRNEHSVLTVSTLLKGEYGINNVCLSVPCVVGQTGVEQIITAPLLNQEQTALFNSAKTIQKVYRSLKV